MQIFKRFRKFVVDAWEPLLLLLGGAIAICFLLLFKLGTLVPGFSLPEIQTRAQSSTLHLLINNPLNLPYKLLIYGALSLHHGGMFVLRSVSVAFALLIIAAFYYVLRRWYNPRIALLGLILFVTSSWLLHSARLATPDILYIMPLLTVAYGAWIQKTQKSRWALFIGAGLAAFLLYIPGLVWFVILGALWQHKLLFHHYRRQPIFGFILLFIWVGLLLPLIYGLYRQPALLKTFGGLPPGGWPQPFTIVKNLVHIPYQLILRRPADPVRWLGRLPLMDVFSLAMATLGAYTCFLLRRLDRSKLVLGGLIVGAALVSLGGSVNILILMPFMYLLVVAGIAFMLQQWFTIFPRNPLAAVIGTSLISLAVIAAAFFHINHYYIAWPNAPETKQVYLIRP